MGERDCDSAVTTASSLEAARNYLRRGFAVVPIPHGKKAPRENDWPNLRLSEADLPARFSNGENIGLILGGPSGGLVDIDLDSPEAVSLASIFLPPTNLVHGRASKRTSHFWFRAVPAPRTERFADIDGSVLAEIRSDGCQTIVPPRYIPPTNISNGSDRVSPQHSNFQSCVEPSLPLYLPRWWLVTGPFADLATTRTTLLPECCSGRDGPKNKSRCSSAPFVRSPGTRRVGAAFDASFQR